ncbi:hypothetical protein [Streptomyces fragilis]|uniref:Transposase n=1 Tax=Streptomyces fragilis TaxID=67301 RepID=A0ABV2YFR7_9ACTN|nr:hypothetical protein [Streptomyces fragilis]
MLRRGTRSVRLADDRVRMRLVLLASAAYAAVLLRVLWQALAGRPCSGRTGRCRRRPRRSWSPW